MKRGQDPLARRACALLCVALVLVFMQAAVASTVASVQHLAGGVGGHHHHQHMLFADIILDFDHTDHGHDGAHHDGDVGHHHRGDLGSASVVLASSSSDWVRGGEVTEPPSHDRLIVSVRHSLPERPPKNILSRA
jgi:hypothetical protein